MYNPYQQYVSSGAQPSATPQYQAPVQTAPQYSSPSSQYPQYSNPATTQPSYPTQYPSNYQYATQQGYPYQYSGYPYGNYQYPPQPGGIKPLTIGLIVAAVVIAIVVVVIIIVFTVGSGSSSSSTSSSGSSSSSSSGQIFDGKTPYAVQQVSSGLVVQWGKRWIYHSNPFVVDTATPTTQLQVSIYNPTTAVQDKQTWIPIPLTGSSSLFYYIFGFLTFRHLLYRT